MVISVDVAEKANLFSLEIEIQSKFTEVIFDIFLISGLDFSTKSLTIINKAYLYRPLTPSQYYFICLIRTSNKNQKIKWHDRGSSL